MSVRKSIFALAAIATLGTTALAPTSASAFGFGGHFGGGHFGGGHFGGHFGGFHGIWHTPARPGFWHGVGAWRGVGLRPGPVCGWHCNPFHPWPRYGGWPRYYPRYGVGGGVAYGSGAGYSAAASAPAAAAPSTGCLTKQELPDGTALFQDLCTQEQAETQPPMPPQPEPQSPPQRRFPRGS
jgi:hypothetical protein